MKPRTFWMSLSFTEQLQVYTLQGASFSKENFYVSFFPRSSHLSLHTQLVHIRLSHCFDRATRLLDLIPTTQAREAHPQFSLNRIEHSGVLPAFGKVALVHRNKDGTRVKQVRRIHEDVVDVPFHHSHPLQLLRHLLHVIRRTIDHEHDGRCLREVLVQLATPLQSTAGRTREGRGGQGSQ